MLPLLIRSLAKLEFEARKDAVLIFGKTLRRQQGQSLPAVEYLTKNPGLVRELVVGYATQEIAMTCGAMLRGTAPGRSYSYHIHTHTNHACMHKLASERKRECVWV